jgi:hypothetical protein
MTSSASSKSEVQPELSPMAALRMLRELIPDRAELRTPQSLDLTDALSSACDAATTEYAVA